MRLKLDLWWGSVVWHLINIGEQLKNTDTAFALKPVKLPEDFLFF